MSQVLIIEDEVHIQRLIKLILEKSGYKVSCVDSGEDGLTYLQANEKPKLILLDIMMPGMGGLATLKNLGQSSAFRDIPVVLLTALAQESVVVQGIKLGAKDYIRKPFNPTDLVKRLQKYMA